MKSLERHHAQLYSVRAVNGTVFAQVSDTDPNLIEDIMALLRIPIAMGTTDTAYFVFSMTTSNFERVNDCHIDYCSTCSVEYFIIPQNICSQSVADT